MGDNHPLGFRRGSRSEDDFRHVVAGDVDRRRLAVVPVELVELPHCRVAGRAGVPAQRRDVLADQHQPGAHDPRDPRQEIQRGAVVHRHDDDAAQEAAPERDDPLGAVFAPEHDGIAFAESELFQAFGKTARRPSDVAVRVRAAAETVVKNQKVPARARQIGEKVNERGARHD